MEYWSRLILSITSEKAACPSGREVRKDGEKYIHRHDFFKKRLCWKEPVEETMPAG